MTFIPTFLAQAARRPEGVCFRHLSRGAVVSRTYDDVASAAGRAAANLRALGVKPGQVVAMIGTHHPDLYGTWLGCVWMGAVPAIFAEPTVRVDKGLYWQRYGELFKRTTPAVLACDPRYRTASESMSVPVVSYADLTQPATAPPVHAAVASDVMLLQHSSGTTGLQKGVMLSHGAVLGHSAAYQRVHPVTDEDVVVTWLPLYHDMGLIACFITPMLHGAAVVWLSPFEWVANPASFLTAVSEYRATHAWLPNFAFAFMASRVPAGRRTFDLSSLRAVVNCSEPITADAVEAFTTRFSEFGMSAAAVSGCYAMAENVFAVTATSLAAPAKRLDVARDVWDREHRAVVQTSGSTRTFVSSGACIDGVDVRIRAPDGADLAALSAGHILVRSPFLFSGYHRRDDLNADLFDVDGYFNTEDLGFLDSEGELYVTGRAKEILIVGGRNVYPQDVEQAVSQCEGVHPGRVVCFGVPLDPLETEGIVVLVESNLAENEWPRVARDILALVPAQLDLDVVDARVVPPGALRKSTSGKLARDGNREWYLELRFGPVPSIVGKRVP